MPLTAEQIARRRDWIGGSDAGRIMNGQWFDLWLLKTGRVEPDDLSDVLAVQLGVVTEELNLNWFERQTGHSVTRRGEEVAHPYYGFMHCTLDGLTSVGDQVAVVQAKWSNPFSRIEEIEQRYMAQVHHEMLVCGCSLAFLSVITGRPSYELIEIRLDDDYAGTLLRREQEFWSFVEYDEAPPDHGAVAAAVKPATYRTIDMSSSNSWAELAAIWLETITPSRRCDKSAKELRAMVGADVREATGHGVTITRSKDGRSLFLKEIRNGR
jgi:predicted phage-related endonuclease